MDDRQILLMIIFTNNLLFLYFQIILAIYLWSSPIPELCGIRFQQAVCPRDLPRQLYFHHPLLSSHYLFPMNPFTNFVFCRHLYVLYHHYLSHAFHPRFIRILSALSNVDLTCDCLVTSLYF